MVGCGDLGSRVARELLDRGCKITTLTRRPIHPALPVRSLYADVLSPDSLTGLNESVDQVLYCLTPATRDPDGYARAYVEGLSKILQQLDQRQPPILNFVSSTAVYGGDHGEWVSESSACQPERFNGRILLQAEERLRTMPRHRSFRLGGIYGPGRTYLIDQVRAQGAGSAADPHWTNRIHVDDAAAAIAHLMSADAFGVFNVVDSNPASDFDVRVWLAAQLGMPVPRNVATAAPIRGRRVANQRLLESGFGFRYPGFREGYAALIAEPKAGVRAPR